MHEIDFQVFGEELVGQRIGWMEMVEVPTQWEHTVHQLNVSSAVVGPRGARISYVETNGGEAFHRGSLEGFMDGAAIEITYGDEGVVDQSQMRLLTSNLSNEYPYASPVQSVLVSGVSAGHGELPGFRDRNWAMTEAEFHELFTSGIREEIDRRGHPEIYKYAYYLMNMSLLHRDFQAEDHLVITGRKRAIADPEQHETTERQIQVASDIHENLHIEHAMSSTLANDIRSDAEDSGDSHAVQFTKESIEERFVRLRRQAHQAELAALEAQGELIVSAGVYIPEGQGPMGRTWPYMSARERDENAAFGRELSGLKANDYATALSELEREKKELMMRARYAAFGRNALNELGDVEADLVQQLARNSTG